MNLKDAKLKRFDVIFQLATGHVWDPEGTVLGSAEKLTWLWSEPFTSPWWPDIYFCTEGDLLAFIYQLLFVCCHHFSLGLHVAWMGVVHWMQSGIKGTITICLYHKKECTLLSVSLLTLSIVCLVMTPVLVFSILKRKNSEIIFIIRR